MHREFDSEPSQPTTVVSKWIKTWNSGLGDQGFKSRVEFKDLKFINRQTVQYEITNLIYFIRGHSL